MKNVKKLWGNEFWIVNNDKYCGKILTIKKGYQSSLHYHKIKQETFYVMSGEILMIIENKFQLMETGEFVHILQGVKHSFIGLNQISSTIIEFSTHHDDKDTYRIEKSKTCYKSMATGLDTDDI